MERSVIVAAVCALLFASFTVTAPAAAEVDPLIALVAEQAAQMPTRLVGASTAQAAASSSDASQRSIGDNVGDAPDARGDLTRARVTYGQRTIDFDFDTVMFANPRTNANWLHGDTAVVWGLDFTGDRAEDFAVVMFTADDGQFVGGSIRSGDESVTCARSATFDATSRRYRVELERSCFGAPRRMRYYMSLAWDGAPSNPDNELAVDWIPNLDGPYYSDWIIKPCRVIPTRTTLPIWPDRVHQGDQASLKGFVFRDGTDNGLGGLIVELQKRPDGGAWRLENSKRTDADGQVRFAPTPVADIEYRLRHPATTCSGGSMSAARFVRVTG